MEQEKIDLVEIFSELPLETQSAIIDADIQTQIQIIGKKHNLHVDQMGALFDATQEVALGIGAYDNFTNTIEQRVGVSRDIAKEITTEVNNAVFRVIRDKMIEIADSIESPDTEEHQINTEETKILANTGITLNMDNVQKALTPDTMQNRSDMLNNLENPPKNEPIVLNTPETVHPLAQKLTQTTSTTTTTTDYSLRTREQKAAPTDPYREMPL